MAIGLLLAQKIAQLFLILLSGFVLVRTHILRVEDGEPLSKLVIWLMLPCVIIASMQIDLTPEIGKGILFTAVVSIVVILLLIFLSHVFGKVFHLQLEDRLAVTYSNSGNLIIPLVQAVFGNEWVVYVTVFFGIQVIVSWMHLDTRYANKKLDIKKLLRNPNILAVELAILLMVLGIRLPDLLQSTLLTIGNMIGPVSMLSIGTTMAGVSLGEMLRNRKAYLTSALRLIVCPLIIMSLFCLFRIHSWVPNGKTITTIMMLWITAPVAVIVTQFAVLYKADAKEASVVNVMSTLACAVTMPIMIALYTMLIGG